MRIIKFNINEKAYETFLNNCKEEEITVKKKLNVLLSQNTSIDTNVNDYFPANHYDAFRTITLKVNEELFKGVMKGSDRLDISVKKFVAYLIYRSISL